MIGLRKREEIKMFKSLKTTDSQNLKAYVEFDSAIISDSKVYGSMFFNIVVCLIGAFISILRI